MSGDSGTSAGTGPSTRSAPKPLDRRYRRKTYAVWELTLKCNLACRHCGSRAGDARTDELSTAEALDLVRQLAEIGIGEISLIGGEAFLRPDWLEIARAIPRHGMGLNMTTGGYGISLETARRMVEAGMEHVSVSVDGLEATHDFLRGKEGSFEQCFKSMAHFREVGLPFGANTQVNRLTAPELPLLYERLKAAGADSWQFMLTVPMGNAADNWKILMQPCELLDLFPLLARICKRAFADGVLAWPGNTVGYYGPYERLFRSGGRDDPWGFWQGCGAGINTLGIEADGKIKGCPSLPTTAYTGGNIRDRSLRDIVAKAPELQINMRAGTPAGTAHLWGFCKTCEFAEVCRAGCTWAAHVFFNRPGNNPYCHHRALTLAARGLRERAEPRIPALGKPFDNGVFALIEEPLDAPWPEGDPLRFTPDKVVWPAGWPEDG